MKQKILLTQLTYYDSWVGIVMYNPILTNMKVFQIFISISPNSTMKIPKMKIPWLTGCGITKRHFCALLKADIQHYGSHRFTDFANFYGFWNVFSSVGWEFFPIRISSSVCIQIIPQRWTKKNNLGTSETPAFLEIGQIPGFFA